MTQLPELTYGKLYQRALTPTIDLVSEEQRDTLRAIDFEILLTWLLGGRVIAFGNGGSGAVASHFIGDLAKNAAVKGKRPVHAFCPHDNITALLAYSNDDGYPLSFAGPLDSYELNELDVVIGISGSGKSPNVLEGIQLAQRCGARTVGITSEHSLTGNIPLTVNSDLAVVMPRRLFDNLGLPKAETDELVMAGLEDCAMVLLHRVIFNLKQNIRRF